MSDSDSDGPALPNDNRIELFLRQTVRQVFKSGNHDDLTVKRIRKAVEEKLHLPDDFLKTNSKWKDRSKDTITDEVQAQEQEEKEPSAAGSSSPKQSKPQKGVSATKSARQGKAAEAPKKQTKRGLVEAKPKARKRRKKSVSDESEDAVLSDASSAEEEPSKWLRGTLKSTVVDESESSDNESPARKESAKPSPLADDAEKAGNAQTKTSPIPAEDEKAADSESEMSVLIDEEPQPKKKRQTKAASGKEKTTKSKSTKGKKDDKDLKPQDAEIKRLQGWLVKCGIRKLWGKELKPYDTPKAKINHLKDMLKDAGMEGRYSEEKARKIKEQRELAADLEAVQEGAKRWGQSDSEEEDGGGRPRRRIARGLKDLEGLVDSDGGEETD